MEIIGKETELKKARTKGMINNFYKQNLIKNVPGLKNEIGLSDTR